MLPSLLGSGWSALEELELFQCSLGWGGGTQQAGECEGAAQEIWGDPCSLPQAPVPRLGQASAQAPWLPEGLTAFPQSHLHPLLHLGVTATSRSQVSAQYLLCVRHCSGTQGPLQSGGEQCTSRMPVFSPCKLPPFTLLPWSKAPLSSLVPSSPLDLYSPFSTQPPEGSPHAPITLPWTPCPLREITRLTFPGGWPCPPVSLLTTVPSPLGSSCPGLPALSPSHLAVEALSQAFP